MNESIQNMPDINKQLLEMDGGELPPEGELGAEEFGAAGNEVATEDLHSGFGFPDEKGKSHDVHEPHPTLQ